MFAKFHQKLRVRKFLNLASYALIFLRNEVASWPRLLAVDELLQYRRVLVLAPHPDDEVFGMGGTLSLLMRRNVALQITWFTCGDNAVRVGEAKAALTCLGIPQSDSAAFPIASASVPLGKAAQVIQREVALFHPDLICVPSVFDPHQDHVRVNLALSQAISSMTWHGAVLQYEVWNSLVPNVLIDISTVIEEKDKLMRLYRSQLDEVKRCYPERIRALNSYRGLVHQVDFAEGFILSSSDEFMQIKRNGKGYPKGLRAN